MREPPGNDFEGGAIGGVCRDNVCTTMARLGRTFEDSRSANKVSPKRAASACNVSREDSLPAPFV